MLMVEIRAPQDHERTVRFLSAFRVLSGCRGWGISDKLLRMMVSAHFCMQLVD